MHHKNKDYLNQKIRNFVPNSNEEVVDKLNNLILLLQSWNKKLNLTSISEYKEVCDLHVIDSALCSPYIKGKNIIDIGSGAGFPGFVLAIINPDKEFSLIDSVRKKTIFQQHVISELDLKNVTSINSRVEKFDPVDKFDSVISRAFSSFEDMIKLTRHLCKPEGCFLTLKSKNYTKEISKNKFFEIKDCIIYKINTGDIDIERYLLEVENNNIKI